MCKDAVNFNEAQLSVQLMEDMAKVLNSYIAQLQELLVMDKGVELLADFEAVGETSLQLKKQLHQLRHKLERYEESLDHPVTITNINKSE
jgi:hypothetical protein